MRASRMWMVVLTVATLAISPTIALASSQADGMFGKNRMIDYRSIQGKVTALDVNSKTIQVTPMDGSMAAPVRVGIGKQTAIRQGILPRTLARLKIGEDVTLRYSGAGHTWFADSINIQDPSVAIAHYRGSR